MVAYALYGGDETNGAPRHWCKGATKVTGHQVGPNDRAGSSSQFAHLPPPRGRWERFTQFIPWLPIQLTRHQLRRYGATRDGTDFVASMRSAGRNKDLPCPVRCEFFFGNSNELFQGTPTQVHHQVNSSTSQVISRWVLRVVFGT